MRNLVNNNPENQIEKLEIYEAPFIEVIEVEIERGFLGSAPSRDNPSW